MSALPKLSVRLHGGLDPRQSLELAKIAERAGFFAVWFAENPFGRGVLPAAAASAAATERIGIGAAAYNPFTRHPTLIAMEIGALDELAPGRVRLGIGLGAGVLRRIGGGGAPPSGALREALLLLRGLLQGQEMTQQGGVFPVEGVRLEYAPRAAIPIYMAGRDGQDVELCGAAADGLLFSSLATAEFAAGLVERLGAASRAAGRTAAPAIVHYAPCACRPDRFAAQTAAKQALAAMLPSFWPLDAALPEARNPLLMGSGITAEEFETAHRRLAAGESADSVIDDRFVAAFALAGDAEDCRAQAERFAAAGVDEVALTFSGASAGEEIAYLGEAFAA